MNIRHETRFRYDSRLLKFYGTRVWGRIPFPIVAFEVLAVQPFQGIYTLDKPNNGSNKPSHEAAGKTEVTGGVLLDSPHDGTEAVLDTPPWDVTIHTYNPADDRAYEAKVLGIQLVSVVPEGDRMRCDFCAETVISWKKVA